MRGVMRAGWVVFQHRYDGHAEMLCVATIAAEQDVHGIQGHLPNPAGPDHTQRPLIGELRPDPTRFVRRTSPPQRHNRG